MDNLVNVGLVERGFRAVYGAFGTAGRYERRAFDFRLLIELAAVDGTVLPARLRRGNQRAGPSTPTWSRRRLQPRSSSTT